jgi:hypothetical protein
VDAEIVTDNESESESEYEYEYETSEEYLLTPCSENKVYEEHRWVTHISSGKLVTIVTTIYYRWCEVNMMITIPERNQLLYRDRIALNDYNSEIGSLKDSWSFNTKIIKPHLYLTDELDEIKRLMHIQDHNDDLGDGFMAAMVASGWNLEDTECHIFGGGCALDGITRGGRIMGCA